MPKCFLAYSEAYRPVMETVRRLLEVFEFEVDLFDGPDLERPAWGVIQRRIASADCMVLVLGPPHPEPGGRDLEPATNPAEEGIYVLGREHPIPLAIILHEGTRLPGVLRDLQTPVRFDFWDPQDVLRHIHHLVKHLLDLQRRVKLPPGAHPLFFTQAINRCLIQRGGTLVVDFYNEIVAREPCSFVHHAIGVGADKRQAALVNLTSPEAFEIQATLNPGRHSVSLEFEPPNGMDVPYFVKFDPPLQPGERLGYRREFELQNYFPLSKAELQKFSEEAGFPESYRAEGRPFYGDTFDNLYETERITMELHFPWRVTLSGKRALVRSTVTNIVDRGETERCNSPELLTLEEHPGSLSRILRLIVPRPKINNQYALLYEPA